MRTIKSQLARLSAASIRLGILHEGHALTINSQIVTAFDLWFPKDERQRVLWPSMVRLSLDYFTSLQKHAVPLDERAIAALFQLGHGPRRLRVARTTSAARRPDVAMGLDVYAWLAQRLRRVAPTSPAFIPWTALKEQFGWHYGRMRDFRRVLVPSRMMLELPAARSPGA